MLTANATDGFCKTFNFDGVVEENNDDEYAIRLVPLSHPIVRAEDNEGEDDGVAFDGRESLEGVMRMHKEETKIKSAGAGNAVLSEGKELNSFLGKRGLLVVERNVMAGELIPADDADADEIKKAIDKACHNSLHGEGEVQ